MLKWFTNKRKPKTIDPDIKQKLEEGYRTLKDSRKCNSLLKRHLTESTFDKLRKLKTGYGSTLLEVIQSGIENLDSGIGVYAPDPNAYIVFAPLFDPIIQDYHDDFKKTDDQPQKDFGNPQLIGNVDIDGQYVISSRIRCSRNIDGYPFSPSLTEDQYMEIERDASFNLKKLRGEYTGTYYSFVKMKRGTQQKLAENNFLFKEGDRFLQAAGGCRFWPIGRGVFHNHDKTFLVWVNQEDHFRIISMQMGGDLGSVYRRLVGGLSSIASRYSNFSRSAHLGYLTVCPSNLGTTLRASIHIKLPKLCADPSCMEKVAEKHNLQIRGKELPNHNGTVFDISNKRRLGITEFEIVKDLHDGVIELIKLERSI